MGLCELGSLEGLSMGAGIPGSACGRLAFSRMLELVAEWVCLDASWTPISFVRLLSTEAAARHLGSSTSAGAVTRSVCIQKELLA